MCQALARGVGEVAGGGGAGAAGRGGDTTLPDSPDAVSSASPGAVPRSSMPNMGRTPVWTPRLSGGGPAVAQSFPSASTVGGGEHQRLSPIPGRALHHSPCTVSAHAHRPPGPTKGR